MAEKQTEAKYHGLRLDLGGCSGEAHTISGLTGWYWKDAPTPVGGPGEVTIEHARHVSRDPGSPVVLVEMTADEQDKRRKEIGDWRARVRRDLRTMTPQTADEAERKRSEQRAAATPKET